MSSSNGHSAVVELPEAGIANALHAFVPRDPGQQWGLCACGLSEAAHVATEHVFLVVANWRCPECVVLDRACNHPHRPGERAL